MGSIEKRRKFIINLIYYASIILLFYAFIKYMLWPLAPLLIAFLVAVMLQKPVDSIANKTNIKKGLISVAAVIVVVGIIAAFVGLVGSRIVNEFREFIDYFTMRLRDIDWIERTAHTALNALPEFIRDGLSGTVDEYLLEIREAMSAHGADAPSIMIGSFNITSLIFPSLTGVWNTAKQIPSIFIAIVVAIVSCCFMTADYERIVGFIKNLAPQEKRHMISRGKNILFSSVGRLLKAYVLIMMITFAEILLGLSIMKIIGVFDSSYIFVIAVLISVVDIFPILGTGTVLGPWAVFSLITGNAGLGIGLIVIYVTVTIIRQILEPKFVATQLDLSPAAAISAMYIGLQIFGIIGMFILPVLLFCAKILSDEGIINFREEEEGEPSKVDDEHPAEDSSE
ncbi:MAG: AI-2E family transporter [Oscillospiraceae bacterium]|jgi:sporulation integral membrane protein YtvI|nr:AI-2E family transporter [Oscillospiraceae bacterium]